MNNNKIRDVVKLKINMKIEKYKYNNNYKNC